MTQRAAKLRGAWSFYRVSLAVIAATCIAGGARAGRDVRITYNSEEDGTAATRNFDLLVVACDPMFVADVFDGRTPLEGRVESALERYTLSTSVWDVRRKKADNAYTVRVVPEKIGAADGQVYAFRDEPRARTGRDRSHTLVTVYQFANTPLSEETILEKLNDAMVPIGGETLASPEYEALGFKAESSEMLDNRHEDGYFPHFSQEDLNDGLPWAVLDAQGSHNTIYVSSFTSHENVNSIYEYGNMLANTTQVQDAFQAARDASTNPRVAVIGAGPSGLLFASQQLKEAGFEDVTIFEKEDRHGGKTLTSFRKAPGYPRKKMIPVEMGTCYLNVGYQAFWTMMETKYGMEKPVRLSFAEEETEPRGMIDGQAGELVDYTAWIQTSLDGEMISLDDFAIALGTYVVAHYSLVGWNSLDSATPIPAGFPEDMPNMTFLEYLQALGLDVLQNAFTYSITVQGYGVLGEIPAYYGLVWMPPDVLTAQLDFAASATEELAAANAAAASSAQEDEDGSVTSEDPDTGHRQKKRRVLKLDENAAVLRHGVRVVRDVRRSAARVLRETGERPSFERAEELAVRSHERVLADEDEAEEDEDEEKSPDRVGLVQEGWLKVWDRIVHQEGLRSKIKLGADITKIERRGLGDYA